MKKYRYQILEENLTRLIEEHKYEAHDILPSYAEIKEEYSLSIATIMRAFDSMERKGLIYSVHGKGTFVSPAVRSRKILILYPGDGFYRDSALFLDGAQKYLFKNNRAYLPILLPLRFVMDNPENITYSYPDIRGIIVFRDFSSFEKLERILGNRDISFLFYGSSWHKPSSDYNSYLYDEEQIARIMVEHLWERGYRHSGAVPFNEEGLGKYRYDLFVRAAEKRGLKILDRFIYRGEQKIVPLLQWLKSREWEGLPLYTSLGSHILSLYYTILKAGLTMPDEIGLIGVDRVQLSDMHEQAPAFLNIPTSRDGQNCVSYLIDLIENKTGSIRGTSPVTVIPGGTLKSL